MQRCRFDDLARVLSRPETRRGVLGVLAGAAGLGAAAATGKRRKRKKCRGPKIRCGRDCCKITSSSPDCCPTRNGKACTNLATDPVNCGACGIACGDGKVCVAGLCWLPCPEPSGCFGAKVCEGGNLCVAVDGVAVCAQSATCDQLSGCTTDPSACPAGTACAAICCGNDANTCRTPV